MAPVTHPPYLPTHHAPHTQVAVSSAAEALRLQRRAAKARQQAATGVNSTSSRSHAVFCIKLTEQPPPQPLPHLQPAAPGGAAAQPAAAAGGRQGGKPPLPGGQAAAQALQAAAAAKGPKVGGRRGPWRRLPPT